VTRVGTGTLRRYSGRHNIRPSHLLRPQAAATDGAAKVELSANEVDVLLGIPTGAAGRLNAIIVLEERRGTSSPIVDSVSLADVHSDLSAQLREPDPSMPNYWLLPPSRTQPTPQTFTALGSVVAGLPLARVRWDPSKGGVVQVLNKLKSELPSARLP
jgi:hypothetical protein